MKSTELGIVALIGVCGGVIALGTMTAVEAEPTSASADAQRETVRSITRACPELFEARDRKTTVTMASVPGMDGQDVAGSMNLTLSGSNSPAATISAAGGAAQVTSFPSEPTSAISLALGGLAPGSLVARSSVDESGEGRGLSSSECSAPASGAWLLGGGSEVGQRDRLVLLNPTDSNAVVDIEIFGPDGKIEATGTDAITVKAHGRTERRLDALASDIPVTAIRVRTSVGLVSAYIVDDRMDELTPRGTDLISDAGSADVRAVIPAVPAGTGTRQLVLFSPEGKGSVDVHAVTGDGVVDLKSATDVKLKQDRVTVIELSQDLKGAAAALDVRADVPVLATVIVQTLEGDADRKARADVIASAQAALKKATGAEARAEAAQRLSDVKAKNRDSGSDTAFFASARSLPTSGAVTAVLPTTNTKVGVTSLDGNTTVRVSVIDSAQAQAGLVSQHEVNIPADSFRELSIKAPGKVSYSVVVERLSGSGRMFAGHHQRGANRGLTGYAVSRLSLYVKVPTANSVVGELG